MRNKALINIIALFFILSVLTGCSSGSQKEIMPPVKTAQILDYSLKKVLDSRRLVATTDYNSTNYFVYRGEPMGYQYELLRAFADYLDVKLKIQINNDIDLSFECLNKKQCDVIALGLTVSKSRKELVEFCDPMSQTRQVLIQRKPENWRKMRSSGAGSYINSSVLISLFNL